MRNGHGEKRRRPDYDAPLRISTATHVVLSVIVGGACGSVVFWRACRERDACVDEHACLAVDDAACSFRNRIAPSDHVSYHVSYNLNASSQALTALVQGPCEPGSRLGWDEQDQKQTCAALFPYPNGLSREIMLTDATTPHMRACGAWIHAGGVQAWWRAPTMRGWLGDEAWKRAVHEVDDERTDNHHLRHDVVSKFRSSCTQTARAGAAAVVASAAIAHRHLTSAMRAGGGGDGLAVALSTLSLHRCGQPLAIDRDYGSSTFALNASIQIGESALMAALRNVGVDALSQSNGVRGRRAVLETYDELRAGGSIGQGQCRGESSLAATIVASLNAPYAQVSFRCVDDTAVMLEAMQRVAMEDGIGMHAFLTI